MKKFLIALLLALVVLFVVVESHKRGFKRGGDKRRRGPFRGWIKSMCKEERPKNCSVFNEDGKCISCDDGFALKEMKLSLACHKAICIPCKYMRFYSQCGNHTGARVCRRGCANCTESGVCTECQAGWKSFTITLFGRNLTKCAKCPWSGCQKKPKSRDGRGMKSILSSVTDGLSSVTDGFRKMKSKMGERLRLIGRLG